MSGGGDSVINVWKDVTVEVEEKKAAEQEEQILLYVLSLSRSLRASVCVLSCVSTVTLAFFFLADSSHLEPVFNLHFL